MTCPRTTGITLRPRVLYRRLTRRRAVPELLLGRRSVGVRFGPGLVCNPFLYACGLFDLVVLCFAGIAHGSSSR